MIIFRTDANKDIATGHVMRCLSIAEQLRGLGKEVLFILSENYFSDKILERGYQVQCLNNDYKQKEEEIELLFELLQNMNVELLLIDSYQITGNYVNNIRDRCMGIKLAYIDDLKMFDYPVDCLINYTYGATDSGYSKAGRLLLGSEYTPLREQFSLCDQTAVQRNNKKIENIFITSGGTDQYHLIIQLVRKLHNSAFEHCRKIVVVGKFYEDMKELQALGKEDETLEIYQNVENMAGLMRCCDIAVSAGGTTVSELFACGVPVIAFSMADNQQGVKNLANHRLLCYAGDTRNGMDELMDRILGIMEELDEDDRTRCQMAKDSHGVVDGLGAKRIAEVLYEMCE